MRWAREKIRRRTAHRSSALVRGVIQGCATFAAAGCVVANSHGGGVVARAAVAAREARVTGFVILGRVKETHPSRSNRGAVFSGRVYARLARSYETKRGFSTPRRPQQREGDERVIRTLNEHCVASTFNGSSHSTLHVPGDWPGLHSPRRPYQVVKMRMSEEVDNALERVARAPLVTMTLVPAQWSEASIGMFAKLHSDRPAGGFPRTGKPRSNLLARRVNHEILGRKART